MIFSNFANRIPKSENQNKVLPQRFLAEAGLLFCTTLALAYSSGLWFLAIPFFIWISFLLRVHLTNHTPLYKKSIAYLAILPFSFWWLLSPTPQGTYFSPWLLIIPSWYFLFLAIWQWRSLYRGGFPVFVRWNSLFVLFLSLRALDRFQIAFTALAFVFLLWSIKPKSKIGPYCISVVLSILLTIGLLFGIQRIYEIQQKHRLSGAWEEKYRSERYMMGFSPVAALGSFRSNYISEKNSQIVLRLWTKNPPTYLRAIAYGDYSGGVWKLPKSGQWILPERYIGDHAVFSANHFNNPNISTDSSYYGDPVWVQASLKTFDYHFAPLHASIAVKAADSVFVTAGNTFQAPKQNRGDWYYLPFKQETFQNSKSGSLTLFDSSANDSDFLHVPKRLDSLFNTIAQDLQLDSLNTEQKALQIQSFLFKNFSYSLQVPFFKRKNKDPLLAFAETRTGFCEYFASFATLALRKVGVPARYIVGFSHPEPYDNGNYYVFRRYNSHAWVEYADNGVWKILDPTPPMLTKPIQESQWARFKEFFKAHSALYIHYLKDGTWREHLDSWSNILEKLLRDFRLYLFLIIAIIFAFRKRIKIFLSHKTALPPNQIHIFKWQKLLNRSEKTLGRLGFSRFPGETVAAFIKRLENNQTTDTTLSLKQKDIFSQIINDLKLYEENRWLASEN